MVEETVSNMFSQSQTATPTSLWLALCGTRRLRLLCSCIFYILLPYFLQSWGLKTPWNLHHVNRESTDSMNFRGAIKHSNPMSGFLRALAPKMRGRYHSNISACVYPIPLNLRVHWGSRVQRMGSVLGICKFLPRRARSRLFELRQGIQSWGCMTASWSFLRLSPPKVKFLELLTQMIASQNLLIYAVCPGSTMTSYYSMAA